MYRILKAEELATKIKLFEVAAPEIAVKARPGQFIILRLNEQGERIPLTIADYNREVGTVTIIFQEVGRTTGEMGRLTAGDSLLDFVGPLGKPTEIKNYGTVVCISGGVGVAPIYPIARALKEAGNTVISMIGARSKDLVILEPEMCKISDHLEVMTDDGSYGRSGLVTAYLHELLENNKKPDLVVSIGPIVMMRAVAETTRFYGVKTLVSLNPIMVDGTGMCGACRVQVNGETKFACIDGPEFDGHLVDWQNVILRSQCYRSEEKKAMELFSGRGGVPVSLNLVREPVSCRVPGERIKSFEEVALGYDEEAAVREAERCRQCKNVPCRQGCPVNVDIPGFIDLIRQRDFRGAINKIKEKNNLPAICGRVCPQERQCESHCILRKKGEAISIGRLERFAADWELAHGRGESEKVTQTGQKVAVVGSGPAGLTAAADLAKAGYQVTVFEALHVEGGVLIYGIPEFRLPKKIVAAEVDYIRSLGVEFQTNRVVGQTLTIDELFMQGYQAVFLGTGAGLPNFMNIPGENLNGVYAANEFLTRTNLMKAYLFPNYLTPVKVGKRVAVIGGGNVALDSARTAIRLGAEEVALVYRRSRDEMPARLEEIEHALEEGVKLSLLTSPLAFNGDENGWIKEMVAVRFELGEPDESGRRRPVPVKGSEHIIQVDTVIIAIGQGPNSLVSQTTEGLETNEKGNIVTINDFGETTRGRIYAGGDIVTGAATVILAMGAGKKAAEGIDIFLKKN